MSHINAATFGVTERGAGSKMNQKPVICTHISRNRDSDCVPHLRTVYVPPRPQWRPTQTERNKTATESAPKTNHGQRHRDHLPGRNENFNPRCEPCNAAEKMNFPPLTSGLTSHTHPTAVLFREEGGRPPVVWSNEQISTRKHTTATGRQFSVEIQQPHHGQLFVHLPVCDFERPFYRSNRAPLP